ncbi:MAG: diaminopropionate ammonia-lyase [Clostridiales bacterium]
MEKMKWEFNHLPKTSDPYLSLMSEEEVRKAQAFHSTIPAYEPTPLAHLSQMAKYLGLKDLFVKNEAFRFGLNSFKVLGGSYAISRFIAQKTGRSEMNYEDLTAPELKEQLGQFTFFSATDGNHGRGVAWAAKRLGQKAVIYMPKGSTQPRLQHILDEGATATIEEGNYDDCVRMAAAESAKTPNSVVIQDTAWEGYEEIPAWIMQGYGTMAIEADLQLQLAGVRKPTHIFVQAGVGSIAAAVQGYFVNRYPQDPPKVIIVEAQAADCIYRGAVAGDGKYRVVDGDIQTIMAGLACGSPNILAWDILKNHSTCFLSCPDWISARGMRMLGVPLKGDPVVISGESGAVNIGAISAIMEFEEYQELRQALGLDKNSVILTFSTEGNTDPYFYRSIVWDGKYPAQE